MKLSFTHVDVRKKQKSWLLIKFILQNIKFAI